MTADAEIDALLIAQINIIAASMSKQPLGLTSHRPDASAQAHRCFQNVFNKIAKAGGGVKYGWTFHHRLVERIPGPGYLFVTHHAVWHATDGHLIDVTPYEDVKHRPLSPGGSTLFLLDDSAKPVCTKNQIAPLPLRFFAIGTCPELISYVMELNNTEQIKCAEIYMNTSKNAY